ncbi:GNAT family N-acetyltransferase [Candidatus Bipolaricaulota sp. J31]
MSAEGEKGMSLTGFVVRKCRDGDAEGVAALLNASDRAWPGTLTGGIPYTPERVLRRHREREHLAILVAEAEGRIVGYLTLTPHWANPAAGYVGFLNVHPDHHGQGIGKALLLEAVSIAARLGLPYLGIDTWSGNERAIGLYKRVGFFWVPGTNVHMENYLPTILRISGVAEFLRGAHWYGCLVREISLEEDGEKWHGRTVFRYRLEREGKAVEVLVDAAAKVPCAIRLPEASLELFPGVAEPCVGFPFSVRFRVENRSAEGRTYALFLTGDRGISLAGGELIRLGPGEAHEGETECALTPELRDLPRRPAPAARLRALTEEGEVELALGFRRRLPLKASLYPARAVLRPGGETEVTLVLQNRSGRRLRGSVRLEAGEGVEVEPRAIELDLPPDDAMAFPLRVRGEPGAWRLRPRVEVEGKVLDLPPLPLAFRSPGDGASGCVLEGMAIAVGDGVWVEAREFGGRLLLFPRGGVHPLIRQGEELGPPYAPAELGQRHWELGLVREGDGIELRMRTGSDRFPGLEVEKRLRLGRGPVVEISYTLLNRGREPVRTSLRVSHWDLPEAPLRIAYMSPDGLVRDVLAGFPEAEGDFPARLPEGWLAIELPAEGLVIGLVPEGEVEWACEWGWSWRTPPIEVPPGDRRALHRYLLYIGPGDYRAVRDLWERVSGAPPAPAEPRPFLWPEFSRPILLRGGKGECAIAVRSGRGRFVRGRFRVVSPAGLRAEPGEGEFEARSGAPGEIRIRFDGEGATRAGLGELVLSGTGEERRFPMPLILLPSDPPEVRAGREKGREVFLIGEEGRRLAVTPDFGPGLYSWREGGVEVLRSAFPEPGRFAWLRPWFGGIHPILYPVSLEEWNWPGKLHEERFEATPWRGRAGEAELAGVALRARPKGEGLRGTEVEVLYATPGGGMVLTALRVRNLTPVPRELGGGFMGFLAPGGTHEGTRMETPGYVRIRSPYHAWWEVEGWALVRGRDGSAFLLCAPPGIPIAPWDAGEEGGHLALGHEFRLGPGEERTIWGWWVYLSPGEDPSPWRELCRLRPAM